MLEIIRRNRISKIVENGVNGGNSINPKQREKKMAVYSITPGETLKKNLRPFFPLPPKKKTL